MQCIDLRDCLDLLKQKSLLSIIKRSVNKDTELMPLVRWQYRGLPEEERRAFLFENVVNSAGRNYHIPVAVSVLASRKVYAAVMQCEPSELLDIWQKGLKSPIAPEVVLASSAPVKDEIHHVADFAREGGGLEEFPIPISTPGFDPAPYITAPYWITKDPDSGVRNVGTYRAMVKSRDRTGILLLASKHIGIQWMKCKERGIPLQAALVIGAPPVVGVASVAQVPYGLDELAVAGGIAGRPIKTVRCEMVDLEVPATAEIVLEGEISTGYLEPEGPFGEFTGYVGPRQMNPVFHIKCITHRKNPVYHAFISQFPPSESSLIRGIGYEAILYRALKNCNIPSVLQVAVHESSGSWEYVVIQMKKQNPAQPWQALNIAVGLDAIVGKIFIAVDEDIDPRDPDAVNWALSFRMQPHLDMRITSGKMAGLDPSGFPPDGAEDDKRFPPPRGASAVLIDATRKWDYPPTSLPKKEFMEHARRIWEEEGLPALRLKLPWHGYNLGYWSHENDEDAALALEGRYLETGEKLLHGRQKL